MQTAYTVGGQVLIMFLLIVIGVIVRKKNIITLEATRVFSNLLITIIMPFMIIGACIRPFDSEDLQGLGLAFVLAVIFHLVAILLANLIIPKRDDPDYRVERMGAVYSNCGFMAFPILLATLGDVGLFYGIAFISISSIFSWTFGWVNLTGERLDIKKALLNPGTVALYVGLLLYFTQLPLPEVATGTIEMLSDVNTPLAMIITGIFLGDVNLKRMFTDRGIYRASLVRLIVAPGAMLVLLWLTGADYWFAGAENVTFANMLAAACPAAAFTTLLVSKLGLNSKRSAEIIAVSTIFSIATVPLFAFLAELL